MQLEKIMKITISPSVDGMSIFEISSSYPLFKVDNLTKIFYTKISFRVNPTNK